jgi:hypothetical protein
MFDPVNIGAPASMPMGVPGASAPGSTGQVAPVSSPMGGPAFPALPMDPASMQYDIETQSDGSILIFTKNPDGSRGPIVDVKPPPKPKGAKSAGPPMM